MIKERYCSFGIARLLKEKGFDEACTCLYYNGDLEFVNDNAYEHVMRNSSIANKDFITAPTHQMACDWLREVYDLHIIAYPYKSGNNKGWCCYVYKTYNLLGQERYVDETCNSYGEAVEAALKYSLENLV